MILYAIGPLLLAQLIVILALAWRGSRLRRVERARPSLYEPGRLVVGKSVRRVA